MNIDEQLVKIETSLGMSQGAFVGGTTIQRSLKHEHGWEWCLAIGRMQSVKKFFYADTIEACVQQALDHLDATKPTKLCDKHWINVDRWYTKFIYK